MGEKQRYARRFPVGRVHGRAGNRSVLRSVILLQVRLALQNSSRAAESRRRFPGGSEARRRQVTTRTHARTHSSSALPQDSHARRKLRGTHDDEAVQSRREATGCAERPSLVSSLISQPRTHPRGGSGRRYGGRACAIGGSGREIKANEQQIRAPRPDARISRLEEIKGGSVSRPVIKL